MFIPLLKWFDFLFAFWFVALFFLPLLSQDALAGGEKKEGEKKKKKEQPKTATTLSLPQNPYISVSQGLA